MLTLRDTVDPPTVEALQLRPEEQQITDLAIVLACRTADHVPDHWRSQTPLGRDFRFTPRHRLLAFIGGADRTAAGKTQQMLSKVGKVPGEWDSLPEVGILELPVPEAIEVELETAVAHDLTLGVAVQIGDRYLMVASDGLDGLVVDEDGSEVVAELASTKKTPAGLSARFVGGKPAGDDEGDD